MLTLPVLKAFRTKYLRLFPVYANPFSYENATISSLHTEPAFLARKTEFSLSSVEFFENAVFLLPCGWRNQNFLSLFFSRTFNYRVTKRMTSLYINWAQNNLTRKLNPGIQRFGYVFVWKAKTIRKHCKVDGNFLKTKKVLWGRVAIGKRNHLGSQCQSGYRKAFSMV